MKTGCCDDPDDIQFGPGGDPCPVIDLGCQGPQADCCDISIDFSSLSDLCPLMPRPQLVTGILTQWMRLHFSDPSHIEIPLLRSYIWTADDTTSKLPIESVFKWNPAMTEARPGIFLKRGPWKVLNLGIDNRKMAGTLDWPYPRQYNVFYQGSLTLFCVGGESLEAELIATEVYRELVGFGPIARKQFGFVRFNVADIGEVSLLDESAEHFVVPVVVSYGAQDTWQICPPSLQELQEFGLYLNPER